MRLHQNKILLPCFMEKMTGFKIKPKHFMVSVGENSRCGFVLVYILTGSNRSCTSCASTPGVSVSELRTDFRQPACSLKPRSTESEHSITSRPRARAFACASCSFVTVGRFVEKGVTLPSHIITSSSHPNTPFLSLSLSLPAPPVHLSLSDRQCAYSPFSIGAFKLNVKM